MSVPNTTLNTVDPDEKWLYRVGGISALVLGIGYILIIALYVPMGARPKGVETWLTYVAKNITGWWVILGLSVLTDLLFVPITLALYFMLKRINKNVLLLALVCVGLFVVLDLALTWTNYAVLITFSGDYNAASSDVQKAAVIAAATYPVAVIESTLLFVYNTLTLSVGILLIGIVMLRSNFGKSAAYVGLSTGVLGIVAVVAPLFISALSFIIIIASTLTTIWVFLVGYKLYRLSNV